AVHTALPPAAAPALKPGLVALPVGDVRVKPSGDLDVADGPRAADLRGEVPEDRQLLHHAEVVRRLVLRSGRLVRGLPRVELGGDRAPLRGRRGEEGPAEPGHAG